MSGVLVFNGHAHATDEVGIKIDNTIIESPNKEPLTRVERWTVTGAVISNGASGSLQTLMNNLEAAYKDGGQNYGNVTYTANGNVHTLTDSATFSGVRVAKFGYMTGPWKMHTELSNRRAFYAVIQAEFRLSADIIKYEESIMQIGDGGPRWRYLSSLTGGPEYQTLATATTIGYVQRGILVKLSSAPSANASLISNTFLHREKTRITSHAPKSITKNGSGQVEKMFATEWYYEGEAATTQSIGAFVVPAL